MNSFQDDYFNLQPQHKSEMREVATLRQRAECVTKRDATEKMLIVQRNLEDGRRKLLDYYMSRSVAIMRATLHRVTTPRPKAQLGIWPRLMSAERRPLDSFPDVTSGDVNKLAEYFISATFFSELFLVAALEKETNNCPSCSTVITFQYKCLLDCRLYS